MNRLTHVLLKHDTGTAIVAPRAPAMPSCLRRGYGALRYPLAKNHSSLTGGTCGLAHTGSCARTRRPILARPNASPSVEPVFYTSGSVMGDIVAWRVVDLPASGQISNVSKLVLRWTAGMPDHGRQVMLPDP